MRRIWFIIVACMVLAVASAARAADGVDTLGTAVKGQQHCSLSIAEGSPSYADPGTTVGYELIEMTGSPIDIEMTDNYLADTSGELTLLGVKILDPLPSQLGPTYHITLGGTLTFYPDNGCSDVNVIPGSPVFTDGVERASVRCFGGCGGHLLHATIHQKFFVLIKANKRLYGDTSDSIILQYTLYDY